MHQNRQFKRNEDAIEHLIKEHKRKHICFVAGKDDNTDSNLRLKIYREVLSENGLSVETA